jgi:hypothetical protein
MPLVLGKKRNEWEEYSLSHAGWLDQSEALALETKKWLEESASFQSPVGESTNDEEDEDNLSTRTRKLASKKVTTFVIVDDESNGRAVNISGQFVGNEQQNTNDAKEQSTETTSPTAKSTPPPTVKETPTPAAKETPPPTSSTPRIPEEIFIKGEDLPGGIEGDLTIVSESWRVHYAPVWQVSPPPKDPTIINYNFLGDATSGGTFNAIRVSGKK